MRRCATEGALVPHVQLDIVLRNAGEVRVIATGGRRVDVVLGRSHRSRDERVHAVSANDESGPLLDRRCALPMASYSRDGLVCHQQLVDGERLAHLGAARCCRVDK